jgi:hypothetical protein
MEPTGPPITPTPKLPVNPARADGEALVAFLVDRDVPCPSCGYNLRRLQSVHCPECGNEVKLTVGAVDVKIGMWVAALIGTLIPAIFGAIVVISLVVNGGRGFGNVQLGLCLIFIYIVLMIPAFLIILANRVAFLRMTKQRQILCITIPWTINAVIVFMIVSGF